VYAVGFLAIELALLRRLMNCGNCPTCDVPLNPDIRDYICRHCNDIYSMEFQPCPRCPTCNAVMSEVGEPEDDGGD